MFGCPHVTLKKGPRSNLTTSEDNFQRNARSGHLIFQNEVNFSAKDGYPPMKISCKLGEASWCSFPLRLLNRKSLYVPDASGGYN